jgi:hypothetical protein
METMETLGTMGTIRHVRKLMALAGVGVFVFALLSCRTAPPKGENSKAVVAAAEPPHVELQSQGFDSRGWLMSAQHQLDIMLAQADSRIIQTLIQAKESRPTLRLRLLAAPGVLNERDLQRLKDVKISLLETRRPVLSQVAVRDGRHILWLLSPMVDVRSEAIGQIAHQYFDEIAQNPDGDFALIAQDQGVELATEEAADDLALDMIAKAQKRVVVSARDLDLVDSDEEKDSSELLEELRGRSGQISIDVRLGCANGQAAKNAQAQLVRLLKNAGAKQVSVCEQGARVAYFARDTDEVLVGILKWPDASTPQRLMALRWAQKDIGKRLQSASLK